MSNVAVSLEPIGLRRRPPMTALGWGSMFMLTDEHARYTGFEWVPLGLGQHVPGMVREREWRETHAEAA